MGGIEMTLVPYKGGPPAMTDMIGDRIDMIFELANVALPHVKAARIKALATANGKPGMAPFATLPTVSETLPGFELSSWLGVSIPAGTPRDVIARLNREIAAVLADDDVRRRVTEGGLDIVRGTPDAFARVIERDYARYAKGVREAGIRAE